MTFVVRQVRTLTRSEIIATNRNGPMCHEITRRTALLGSVTAGLVVGLPSAIIPLSNAHAAFGPLIRNTVFRGAPNLQQAAVRPGEVVAATLPVRNISNEPQAGAIGARLQLPDTRTFYDSKEIDLKQNQEALIDWYAEAEQLMLIGLYLIQFATAMQSVNARFNVNRRV